MLALLVSDRAAATAAGATPLPPERHEAVELLLENYHRRLQAGRRARAASVCGSAHAPLAPAPSFHTPAPQYRAGGAIRSAGNRRQQNAR
jgi:hypothetical protein